MVFNGVVIGFIVTPNYGPGLGDNRIYIQQICGPRVSTSQNGPLGSASRFWGNYFAYLWSPGKVSGYLSRVCGGRLATPDLRPTCSRFGLLSAGRKHLVRTPRNLDPT